jgi:hypothetical protein
MKYIGAYYLKLHQSSYKRYQPINVHYIGAWHLTTPITLQKVTAWSEAMHTPGYAS